MKRILFLAIGLTAFTITRAQFNCDDNFSERQVHITGGVPFNATFEVGLQWKVFGFSAGIKSYDEAIKTKTGTAFAGNNITVFGRGIVSIVETRGFRWLLTGYYGIGVAGASTRMQIRMGQGDWSIIGEPGYSKEQGKFVNAGVSFNF